MAINLRVNEKSVSVKSPTDTPLLWVLRDELDLVGTKFGCGAALGVGQRRREIGVRMALGARAGQVVTLFYAGGVRLGIIGLVLGLPISLVANYWLNSGTTNPDTTPSIALVGGIVAIIVLAVASVATLIPATRASQVDPVAALRSE